MQRQAVLHILIGVILGIVIGVPIGLSIADEGERARRARPAPPGAAPGGGAPSSPPAPSAADRERIAPLRARTAVAPDDRAAWVQLGNACFDAGLAQEAVDAYGRALALDPADANVLTDQGVMFRRLGRFPEAVAAFEQAARIDATHSASLFNLGIVYRYDLQDLPRAREAWERCLRVDPDGPRSARVRFELDAIR